MLPPLSSASSADAAVKAVRLHGATQTYMWSPNERASVWPGLRCLATSAPPCCGEHTTAGQRGNPRSFIQIVSPGCSVSPGCCIRSRVRVSSRRASAVLDPDLDTWKVVKWIPNETTERPTIFSGLFVSRTAPPRSPATWGLQSASVRAARMHNTRSRVIFFSSDLRVLEHLGLRRLLDRVSEKLRPLLKFLDLLLLPRCRRSMQSCFCLSVLAVSTSALPASARPSLHIYMHMHISVVADEKQASRRCTLCQLIRYTKLQQPSRCTQMSFVTIVCT